MNHFKQILSLWPRHPRHHQQHKFTLFTLFTNLMKHFIHPYSKSLLSSTYYNSYSFSCSLSYSSSSGTTHDIWLPKILFTKAYNNIAIWILCVGWNRRWLCWWLSNCSIHNPQWTIVCGRLEKLCWDRRWGSKALFILLCLVKYPVFFSNLFFCRTLLIQLNIRAFILKLEATWNGFQLWSMRMLEKI